MCRSFRVEHDAGVENGQTGRIHEYGIEVGLLNLVATRLGKQGLRSLERRERFITELGIEGG